MNLYPTFKQIQQARADKIDQKCKQSIDSDVQQTKYRKSCTHHRIGGVVHRVIDNSIAFDGSSKDCIGCNAAKRFVRNNGLKSYTT